MAEIDVKSSGLVGIASKNPISISKLELTPWDFPFLPFDPIQKGILFRKPESEHLQQTLIDHLKNSLSGALDFFPPLAGRLATTQNEGGATGFFVDCNNAGAGFTHAVADHVSVSDILEPKYIPEIVSQLLPLTGVRNYGGTSKPLLAVQVTELADGIFVGLAANHAVVDGTSFWHFFNSWSEIARGSDKISKIPVFDRWFPGDVPNEIRLPQLKQNLPQNYVRPPLLERIFHFSKESLAKLKAKANAEAETDKISTLQALSGHLWRSYVRGRNSSSQSSQEEASFMMMVGARARIPLPDGYFGNGAYIPEISTTEAELLQNGLGYAALKVNELVAQQTKEATIEFLKNRASRPSILRGGRSALVISSSPRHNVYANDFGWGKPLAVRSGKGQKFDGKVTVYPAAVAGGMDVEVCFAPETLQAMGDDAEFMEAFTV